MPRAGGRGCVSGPAEGSSNCGKKAIAMSCLGAGVMAMPAAQCLVGLGGGSGVPCQLTLLCTRVRLYLEKDKDSLV